MIYVYKQQQKYTFGVTQSVRQYTVIYMVSMSTAMVLSLNPQDQCQGIVYHGNNQSRVCHSLPDSPHSNTMAVSVLLRRLQIIAIFVSDKYYCEYR